MNNKVLDIYSDDLTDAETESLFSTPKESRKGDRRKIDYKKAKRKAKIDLARSFDGLPMYDNLHQYSAREGSNRRCDRTGRRLWRVCI